MQDSHAGSLVDARGRHRGRDPAAASRRFFSSISGPPVGEPRPDAPRRRVMRSGIRVPPGGVARLHPDAVPGLRRLVAAMADAGGIGVARPPFSFWGVCWLLMPLACVLPRGAERDQAAAPLRRGAQVDDLRLRRSAAAALFVAYPLVEVTRRPFEDAGDRAGLASGHDRELQQDDLRSDRRLRRLRAREAPAPRQGADQEPAQAARYDLVARMFGPRDLAISTLAILAPSTPPARGDVARVSLDLTDAAMMTPEARPRAARPRCSARPSPGRRSTSRRSSPTRKAR